MADLAPRYCAGNNVRSNLGAEVTQCRGLNCSSTSLIKAHILPKGFAKLIRSEENDELLKASSDGVSKAFPQLGLTDSKILCAKCDGKLGDCDGYAVKACKEFQPDNADSNPFESKNTDASRFSNFILSYLWRASISTAGRYCGVVTFGSLYEPLARHIVFGASPLSELAAFKLFVTRVWSDNHNVQGITTDPLRFKFKDLNAYAFLLAGFRIIAVLDGRELPSYFDALIINRTGVFRGSNEKLETLPEYARLQQIFAQSRGAVERAASDVATKKTSAT